MSDINRAVASYGTQFSFIQPGSPWQNGCSEALIKSVKRTMRWLTGSDSPKFSVLQLQRVLNGIANTLNERPIGKHPKEPEDGRFLCPNDLLLGRSSAFTKCAPFPDLTGDQGKYTEQMVSCERLIDEWHKRWTNLYFDTLVPESKWHSDGREVSVGDLVLIKDTNLVRGEWKRGEVISVN